MKICKDIQEIVDAVGTSLNRQIGFIISLDGVDGIGKTSVASKLAQLLGGVHIEFDKFRNASEDSYLNSIRYHELSDRVRGQLPLTKDLVCEGICAMQVFERLRICPDLTIYVQKVTPINDYLLPAYSEMISAKLPPADYLRQSTQEAEALAREFGKSPRTIDPLAESITKDLYCYHYNYHPKDKADIVFQNVWRAT